MKRSTYSLARHTFWIFGVAAMVASMALVGCGSNGNSGAVQPTPIAPITPAAPVTPGVGGNLLASNLSIVDGKNFELFLQNAQTGCDPRIVGWSFGAAACESYSHAGYLYVQATGGGVGTLPTALFITVGAGAGTPWGVNTRWTTEVKRPSFQMNSIAFANNSQGFTATGPYGFRMVVNKGFPRADYQMSVELQYNGIVFARGNLIAQ